MIGTTAALIGAGLMAGGSVAGGALASRNKGNASTPLDPEIKRLLSLKENQSQFSFDAAKGLLPKATETMDAPLDYWMKLLTGDQQAIQEAVAPEAGRIISQYDAAQKAVTELSPRSGARSSTLSELPFRKISDVSSLVAGVRPRAAEAVSSIGGQQAALATALLSGSSGDLSEVINTLTQQRGQNIADSAASRQTWSNVGSGAGQLLAALLLRGKG